MPSDSFKDYYADLGLELGASAGAIRKAFQDLAKKHHPDKSGIADATVFRRVREAFEKLSDPEYRAQYDRSYWRRTQEARSASPPPVKPQRKPNEPSWQYFLGKAYTTWQKEEVAYRVRHPEVYESPLSSGPPTPKPGGMAHGMVVLMSHPCVQQSCIYKSTAWRLQTGGGDHCVFCMAVHTRGRRCPGCEVLACKVCLEKVRALERSPFEGLRSKAQYCSSGG